VGHDRIGGCAAAYLHIHLWGHYTACKRNLRNICTRE
jgi:hypothetical protein